VLALRLAAIKCHARTEVREDALDLAIDGQGQQVHLTFGEAWAASRPRTLYLLQEEVQAWERSGALSLVLRARAGRESR